MVTPDGGKLRSERLCKPDDSNIPDADLLHEMVGSNKCKFKRGHHYRLDRTRCGRSFRESFEKSICLDHIFAAKAFTE
jgi:hypothetical protein